MKKIFWVSLLVTLIVFLVGCGKDDEEEKGNNENRYTLHSNILATTFWAGEGESGDNGFISNVPSAWDSRWGDKYTVNGQAKEDAPNVSRDGDFFPTGYDGTENVYYFALPYNDRDRLVFEDINASDAKLEAVVALDANYSKSGKKVRTSAYNEDVNQESVKDNAKSIPWYNTENWSQKSAVKGRWIRVRSTDQRNSGQKGNGEWVYAQWLDAGPYHYDDFGYVFSDKKQRNSGNTGVNPYAGIDLSPAVMLKMGFSKTEMGNWGINRTVDWQFVDYRDVPSGPWKRVLSDNIIRW